MNDAFESIKKNLDILDKYTQELETEIELLQEELGKACDTISSLNEQLKEGGSQ